MVQLLIHLRVMQLFAHSSHNLVSRIPFFQDHEFFGEVYPQYESDYDGVAERIIGLTGEQQLALGPILQAVSAKLQTAPSVGAKENSIYFQYLLQLEMELCKLIQSIISQGTSEGTKQMLGDICNLSEMRQYKIKRRLGK